MGMGIVVGKLVTLGELVRVAAVAKAKEKGVGLGRKIGVITEDQAYYYVYRF